eukprot:SAG11_NODE_11618_length_748_cov_1.665639_1_plen_71_part_00
MNLLMNIRAAVLYPGTTGTCKFKFSFVGVQCGTCSCTRVLRNMIEKHDREKETFGGKAQISAKMLNQKLN